MKRLLTTFVFLLAGLVAAVGCGGDSSDHNAQDVSFARNMVPHHQQAVTMSDLAVSRSTNPQIRELASRIKAAQAPEISLMQRWLASWGESSSDHGGHGGGMGGSGSDGMQGMVSGSNMQSLGSASGVEFDRLFLRYMTEHHRGAVDMAKIQLDDGKFEPAKQLAGQIVSSQEKEIAEMAQLEAALPPAATP